MEQNRNWVMSDKYKAHCRDYYTRQEEELNKQKIEDEKRRFKIHKEPSKMDMAVEKLKIPCSIAIILTLINLIIKGFTG